jgi:ABC-type transport system substrate-binding protein
VSRSRSSARNHDAWLVEKYGINRPGGQLFVSPLAGTRYFVFNHSRPAFSEPGQVAPKKAINFAIDRPALARPRGHLLGERTDQMLPPPPGRAEGIYPRGDANLDAARRGLAKARIVSHPVYGFDLAAARKR